MEKFLYIEQTKKCIYWITENKKITISIFDELNLPYTENKVLVIKKDENVERYKRILKIIRGLSGKTQENAYICKNKDVTKLLKWFSDNNVDINSSVVQKRFCINMLFYSLYISIFEKILFLLTEYSDLYFKYDFKSKLNHINVKKTIDEYKKEPTGEKSQFKPILFATDAELFIEKNGDTIKQIVKELREYRGNLAHNLEKEILENWHKDACMKNGIFLINNLEKAYALIYKNMVNQIENVEKTINDKKVIQNIRLKNASLYKSFLASLSLVYITRENIKNIKNTFAQKQ
ncbi:MAG: hypothetical protein LBJ97_04400 [Mycoplasmataceae bacterium]|nr:hypothetical protein [Mycoplasmataceae bacterium]